MTAIPSATWEGEFKIFGVTIRCAVLDDEARTRVLNCDDLVDLFEALQRDVPPTGADEAEFGKLLGWSKGFFNGIHDQNPCL